MEENIKSPEEFLTEFSKDLHEIYVEEMKRTFDAHDYEYRDLPWMSDECMSEIVNIIGPTNIKFISGSARYAGNTRQSRASILISPTGMENLKTYNRNRKNTDEVT